jgi:N-acetylglucosaminyldiphosphoundecaprenol N-acetyl-beta-D-mannosaminyltransferase
VAGPMAHPPLRGDANVGDVDGREIVECLGVGVARLDWVDFRRWFATHARVDRHCPATLYFVNAHSLNRAWSRPDFRALLNRGDLVLNDGVGLQISSALEGRNFRHNFNGTDLFPRLFNELSAEGQTIRVFLYGARPGRADSAARSIQARYPGIEVVGIQDGYRADDEKVVAAINEARPDLLLVAKGTPLQEQWLDTYASSLEVGVAAGVGALFDFMSEAVPRAPLWMRVARLEWVFRLVQEPRRMFRRYVIGVPLFLARTLTERFRHR